MKTEFSTFDIGKAMPDIPRERLREWMVKGFIKPTVASTGHGSKAIFTRIDVYGVALFRFLLDRGLSRSIASEYVQDFIAKEKADPIEHQTKYIMLLDDRTSFTLGAGGYKIDLETGCVEVNNLQIGKPRKWDAMIVVNYEQMRHDIDVALGKL